VPVIASGGAGSADDVVAVLAEGGASAALLASTLHFGLLGIDELKAAMARAGLPVRRRAAPVAPAEVAAWLG
jgi:cyclase